MRELEQQLTSWKESLVRAGTFTTDDIAELELHVRDSMRDLEARGLAQEEALYLALKRVGDSATLAVEYGKVNPGLAWARRWCWMAAGFLVFTFAIEGIGVLGYLTAWLASTRGLAGAGLIGAVLAGYGVLCLAMVRSARTPSGRLAHLLQRAAREFAAHPYAVALALFLALLALRAVKASAMFAVIGEPSVDDVSFAVWVGLFNGLAAVAVPTLLFLLSRHIGRMGAARPAEVGR